MSSWARCMVTRLPKGGLRTREAASTVRNLPLVEAARAASRAAADAVRHGLPELGAGDGPVDILNVKGRT